MLYDFIKYYTEFKNSVNYSIFDKTMQSEFKTEVDDMELREHILWAVKEEGRDEGREEGREEGMGVSMQIMQALRAGESPEAIAAKLKEPIENINSLRALMGI